MTVNKLHILVYVHVDLIFKRTCSPTWTLDTMEDVIFDQDGAIYRRKLSLWIINCPVLYLLSSIRGEPVSSSALGLGVNGCSGGECSVNLPVTQLILLGGVERTPKWPSLS